LKNVVDLLVEFVSVGDDRYASDWVIFKDPLGQEHHDEAFTASLGVPNDTHFSLPDVLLRILDADVLMHAR
jgi:hypothetical protein